MLRPTTTCMQPCTCLRRWRRGADGGLGPILRALPAMASDSRADGRLPRGSCAAACMELCSELDRVLRDQWELTGSSPTFNGRWAVGMAACHAHACQPTRGQCMRRGLFTSRRARAVSAAAIAEQILASPGFRVVLRLTATSLAEVEVRWEARRQRCWIQPKLAFPVRRPSPASSMDGSSKRTAELPSLPPAASHPPLPCCNTQAAPLEDLRRLRQLMEHCRLLSLVDQLLFYEQDGDREDLPVWQACMGALSFAGLARLVSPTELCCAAETGRRGEVWGRGRRGRCPGIVDAQQRAMLLHAL